MSEFPLVHLRNHARLEAAAALEAFPTSKEFSISSGDFLKTNLELLRRECENFGVALFSKGLHRSLCTGTGRM